MVCASGSEAEAVAMVVPVATFSAKEDAANELVRLGASLISPTLMVSVSETELAPSEAVKVIAYAVAVS